MVAIFPAADFDDATILLQKFGVNNCCKIL
jgi:hypothetical protein